MNSLLIKNGTVVTATDRYHADVYIEGEKVSMIGTHLTMAADREIDAKGCYLFPGGIDAHTHMELPFMGTHASDTFESGTSLISRYRRRAIPWKRRSKNGTRRPMVMPWVIMHSTAR